MPWIMWGLMKNGVVIGRFRSALATLHRMPSTSRDRPRAKLGTSMPEPMRSRDESYGTAAAQAKFQAQARTQATPEQIAQMDEVLFEWQFMVDDQERFVLWHVAAGLPKREIGKRMTPRVSRYTVIRREKAAVAKIERRSR